MKDLYYLATIIINYFFMLFKLTTLLHRFPRCSFAVILLLHVQYDPCAAQGYSFSGNCPVHYVSYRTETPLVIDGVLDEAAWQLAPWTGLFVDIEGEHMPAPLHPTRVKMLWDEQYFYIGAWLEEPHLWATYTQRESVIFHENDFEVFIDPDGDTHRYYEIEINALGTIWDLMLVKPYRDGGPARTGWDALGMLSAVKLFGTLNDPTDLDSAWTVEFAIPWKAMEEYAGEKAFPGEGEQMRVNFSRVQWRLEVEDGAYSKVINPETGKPWPEYNWVWSPQGVIAMHQPETWGYVQFTRHPSSTAEVPFVCPPDERIKWSLRQIYYLQRQHRHEHGAWSTDLPTLLEGTGVQTGHLAGLQLLPAEGGYTLICRSADGTRWWHLRQDGRIWLETGP